MMGCYTHNYRNRGNSFNDLVSRLEKGNKGLEKITFDEKNKLVTSIQEGYGFSCSRCVAVCPAAKKGRVKYDADSKEYYQTYVKPFITKEEMIYVLKGSRSADYVGKNLMKRVKLVTNGMTIDNIKAFKGGVKMAFNPEKAKGLNRNYQFVFTGAEVDSFIVKIENGKLKIENGIDDNSDISIKADSGLWLKSLQNKKAILIGMLTGKARIKGNPKYLKEFGEIFAT